MTNAEYTYEMTEVVRGIISSDLFSADEKMAEIHKMTQSLNKRWESKLNSLK